MSNQETNALPSRGGEKRARGILFTLLAVGAVAVVVIVWWILTSVAVESPTAMARSSILSWIDESGVDLADGTFRPGKVVTMEEIGFEAAVPSTFETWESFDILFDRMARRFLGWERVERPLQRFSVAVVGAGRARSERPWGLPGVDLPRRIRTFHFKNDSGQSSPRIASTNVGQIHFRLGGFLRRGSEEDVELELSGEIRGVLEFVPNPDQVRLTVMTPWGSGEADLLAYLEEYEAHLVAVIPDLFPGVFTEFYGGYLRPELGGEWEIELVETVLTRGLGDQQEIRIRYLAPTPGGTLMAIRVTDVTNEDNFTVSELLALGRV